MDFLLSDHPVAKTLTDHIVFMIVPMLNPDGVVLGNYRYRSSDRFFSTRAVLVLQNSFNTRTMTVILYFATTFLHIHL